MARDKSEIQRIGGKFNKYLKHLQEDGPKNSKGKPRYTLPELTDMIAEIRPLDIRKRR